MAWSELLVWQDSRFSGGAHDDIAIAESTDGGLTWGAPVRVKNGAVPAFNPSVEITSSGRLGVGYHELTGTRLLATSASALISGLTLVVIAGGPANPITNASELLGATSWVTRRVSPPAARPRPSVGNRIRRLDQVPR